MSHAFSLVETNYSSYFLVQTIKRADAKPLVKTNFIPYL